MIPYKVGHPLSVVHHEVKYQRGHHFEPGSVAALVAPWKKPSESKQFFLNGSLIKSFEVAVSTPLALI